MAAFAIQAPVAVNALVGPPGCGKTTELARLVALAVERGWQPLICSLTRAAAREVAGRDLPIDPARIGTLHAHAYRALDRPTIAEGELAKWNEWLVAEGKLLAWQIPPSYGKKRRVDDPKDEPRSADDPIFGQRGVELLERAGIYRACLVPETAWPSVELRAFHQAWTAWKRDFGLHDFADLIEACYEDGIGPAVEFDALYVDEAQDLSRAEMRLVLAWAERARETVIVGDPWQNLYEWRGSEPQVFTGLIQQAKRRRTLEQSYRVPRAVHAEAMAWVSQLEDSLEIVYQPRDDEGTVTRLPLSLSRNVLPLLLDELELRTAGGQTVMVLASCNYLLDDLVAALRRAGVPFHNPYRVTHGGWNPLGQAYKPGSGPGRILAFSRVRPDLWGDDARFWAADELAAWTAPLSASVFAHGAKKAIERGEVRTPEQLADLVPEADDLEAMFRGDLDWYDRNLLASAAKTLAYPLEIARRRGVRALLETPKLIVGTVHSVKGGEADSVFVFPDLSPAAFDEWQRGERDAIVRTFYVALTRARRELVLGRASGPRAVVW